MYILGVCYNTDASACLFKNGKLISAISEERLNRKKSWFGVPHRSIEMLLKMNNLNINDIKFIACHGLTNRRVNQKRYEEVESLINKSKLTNNKKSTQLFYLKERSVREQNVYKNRIPNYLKELKKYKIPLKIFSHHHCHAASAFYPARKKNGFIITIDGWGEDGLSATLWSIKNFKIKMLSQSGILDSLGYFYGSVTQSLGFIPHRHEGKVLGLAAYGRPNPSLVKISNCISFNKNNNTFNSHMENGIYKPQFNNTDLTKYIKKYSKKDVAYCTQKTLENVVCKFVRQLPGKDINLFLAGGIFANVKLNQKIKEQRNISNVYIFPNMGDGGLCVGAASLAYLEEYKKFPEKIKTMFLGNAIDTNELESLLKKKKYNFKKYSNIQMKVASLLANKDIVIRVNGRMEFGPRALGNRSILFNCSDKSVNKWLNKKLKRTEFMPFAPATLYIDSKKMYNKLEGGLEASSFMTMTFNCTKRMKKESPAAIHIDGTARPQLITKENNPDFFKILIEYKKLTNKSSLINTSFNMHEEPIVSSAEDALRAFEESQLPWLAIEDYLISK